MVPTANVSSSASGLSAGGNGGAAAKGAGTNPARAGNRAWPTAQTSPRHSTVMPSPSSVSAALTITVSPSYTGFRKRHSAVPRSSHPAPQRATGKCVM
jgi:hypothetical protein